MNSRIYLSGCDKAAHGTCDNETGQSWPITLDLLVVYSSPMDKANRPTDLGKFRKQKRKATAQGKTLCARGFHKWVDDGRKQFDVKQGRLVSIKRCLRCGLQKTVIG